MKNLHLHIIVFALLGTALLGYSQKVGDPAPDFTLTSLDGNEFNLSNQEGKVVFMFLFGNTCPFCIASGPDTESEIYSEFKDNDNFIAVGMDLWNGSKESVENFKSQTGISYTLLLNAGSVGSDYKTTYDRAIVIDQDGLIQHKGSSAVSNDISNVKSVIQNLLDESTVTNVNEVNENSTHLSSVYPNPVTNASSIIEFGLGNSQRVTLEIINASGQVVAKPVHNQLYPEGNHKIQVDLQELSNGLYFYRLNAGTYNQARKMYIRREK